jgi:hypothetical protein
VKAGLASILALMACAPAEPPLMTVDQYLAACPAILGKQVRVAGYVGECGVYSCVLFAGKPQLDAETRWTRAIAEEATRASAEHRDADSSKLGDPPKWIGIGNDRNFDRKVSGFQNSYVVIAGRVDDKNCTGEGGMDRVFGIVPTDIRSWTPAEGAPTNTN